MTFGITLVKCMGDWCHAGSGGANAPYCGLELTIITSHSNPRNTIVPGISIALLSFFSVSHLCRPSEIRKLIHTTAYNILFVQPISHLIWMSHTVRRRKRGVHKLATCGTSKPNPKLQTNHFIDERLRFSDVKSSRTLWFEPRPKLSSASVSASSICPCTTCPGENGKR